MGLVCGAPGPNEGGPASGLPLGRAGHPHAREQGGSLRGRAGDQVRGGGGTKASTDGTHRGEGGVNLSQILKLKNDGKRKQWYLNIARFANAVPVAVY